MGDWRETLQVEERCRAFIRVRQLAVKIQFQGDLQDPLDVLCPSVLKENRREMPGSATAPEIVAGALDVVPRTASAATA